MIKFLKALLPLVVQLWAAWRDHSLRQQGKQEAVKEAEDALEHQIELAEHTAVAADDARDKRLRSRFDAAASD